MYRPGLGSVSDVWRVWFDSWRPWHVALLMGASVAAMIGMTLLLHHGVWVLLPIVCLAPLALHLDLSVRDVAELDAVRDRVIALGGTLRLDRAGDQEEPLRIHADPDGHPFCVFVTNG